MVARKMKSFGFHGRRSMGRKDKETTASPGAPPPEERQADDGELLADDGSMGAWNEDEEEGTIDPAADRDARHAGGHQASAGTRRDEEGHALGSAPNEEGGEGGERGERAPTRRDGGRR
jgi:hypothetical protein